MSLPGKIRDYYGKEGPPNVLNNDALDMATLSAMKSSMLRITSLAESCPDFHDPKGFDLHAQISMNRSSPYNYPVQHVITADAWLAIHEFYKDQDGKTATNEETGAGLFIRVNRLLKLFPDGSGGDCDKFNLPRFFFRNSFVVKDSTADLLLLKNGTRVITNGKPLFVPYTKEQYLQFLIKKNGKILEDQKKFLQEVKDMKERAAIAPDGHKVTEADKDNGKYNYLLIISKGADQNMETALKNVEATSKQLNELNGQLKNMPAAEKNKQAYIYINTSDDAGRDENGKAKDADKFFKLTMENDPHGIALCTPNPVYFNSSLSNAAVQLITIVENVDTRFISGEYVRILDRVRDCIDYKALKSLILQ
jgi:hypothetical protein